jgi:hypothetical protein
LQSRTSSRLAVTLIAAAGLLAGCDFFADRPLDLDASWHKQALIDGHCRTG